MPNIDIKIAVDEAPTETGFPKTVRQVETVERITDIDTGESKTRLLSIAQEPTIIKKEPEKPNFDVRYVGQQRLQSTAFGEEVGYQEVAQRVQKAAKPDDDVNPAESDAEFAEPARAEGAETGYPRLIRQVEQIKRETDLDSGHSVTRLEGVVVPPTVILTDDTPPTLDSGYYIGQQELQVSPSGGIQVRPLKQRVRRTSKEQDPYRKVRQKYNESMLRAALKKQ